MTFVAEPYRFDIPNLESVDSFGIESTGDLDCESLSRALEIRTSTVVHRYFGCSGAAEASMNFDLWDYTPVASPFTGSTSIFVAPTTTSTSPQPALPTTTSYGSQSTPTSNTASIRNISWSLVSSISAIVGFAFFC